MNFSTALTTLRNLGVNTTALAAIGAEAQLRLRDVDGDPAMRAALNAVVDAVQPGLLDDLDRQQLTVVASILSFNLRAALDLISNAERAGGWSHTDPATLQQIGRASASLALTIDEIAKERPALAALLDPGHAFLDIGTGVGWISIQGAKLWPGMRIVGIDIWEPSLQLAAENVAAEGVADRVTLRKQNILELDEESTYDLIWLPSMFVPKEVLLAALPRIVRALTPDGVLVFGAFAVPEGPYAQAVTDLTTVRSGGYPWTLDEITAELRSHGLAQVERVRHGTASATITLASRS